MLEFHDAIPNLAGKQRFTNIVTAEAAGFPDEISDHKT